MEEEKIVVQPIDEVDHVVTVEEIEQDIANNSTTEYIEIDEPEEIFIEVSESPVAFNSDGAITHNSLPDRNISNQHEISAITNLQNILDKLSSTRTVHSTYGGFAEFQEWLNSGYYKNEDYYRNSSGVGYFVSLVTETGNAYGGNVYVDICKKTNADNTVDVTDIYGVTVSNSGFYGYQSSDYDFLDSKSINHANNPDYAKVCLLGTVDVRVTKEEHENIRIGDYVVPNELGYAKKSINDIGFKVISKGQKDDGADSWRYVRIALVPQNDNASRVIGKLEEYGKNLGDITIQLGDVSDKLGSIENSNIQLGEDFKGLEDLVNESTVKIDEQREIINKVQEESNKVVADANQTIETVRMEYVDAVNKADDALKKLYGDDGENGVLDDLKDLQDNMKPLATWVGKDGSNGTAAFVAQAEENNTALASLTKVFGNDASYLTAIIQKIDENGAAIQHLVTHVDKYILGEQSPTYGLSLEQTGFIQPGTIYVPTINHQETYEYKDGEEEKSVTFNFVYQVIDEDENSLGYGQSYIWAVAENLPYQYMWKEYKNVSLSTESFNGEADEDLWYCWQGVMAGDKYVYDPCTLYCWNNKKQIWTPVASIGDNAASIGSVNQTAKNFQIAYTNLKGDVSALEVRVDGISTVVNDEVQGKLSAIDQTAQEIMMGVYERGDDSTSLSLLLDGMTSSSINTNHVLIKHVLNEHPTPIGNRYSQKPIWDGEEFVFVESTQKDNGEYYFDSDVHTYYCQDTADGYNVYGIGNIAMNSLKTRVTNTESEIQSWTQFKSEMNETMTSISQSSSETDAEIFSMVFGEYIQRIDIKTELTDEDFSNVLRYTKTPEWKEDDEGVKVFVFDANSQDVNGIYCLPPNEDSSCYYKLLLNSEKDIVGYEEYKMKSSNYASIMQKTDENGSSIGLVSGNDDAIGSLFVKAINDKSEVLINADKIGIDGTAIFTDSDKEGYTVISGNYIGTGILQSNNYEAPLEGNIFAQNGTLFNLDDGTINSVNFDLNASGDVSIVGKITATSGYIGNSTSGFTIGSTSLYNGQSTLTGRGIEGVYIGTDGIGLGSGAFYVDTAGYLYANNAIITGDIIGSNIYGGYIYASADNTSWYTKMDGKSLTLYDNSNNPKIELGAGSLSSTYVHPYIQIGSGIKGDEKNTKGCIHKMGYGLWIGDSSTIDHEADYPNTDVAPKDGDDTDLGTGLFFDFKNGNIFKYVNGKISEIGSGSGSGNVAVFG